MTKANSAVTLPASNSEIHLREMPLRLANSD